jgi:hypothetical protein
LFINFPPITEADFRNTIVHEGQHVADWSFLNQPTQKSLQSGDWKAALELYKSEFRAYWIQPPTPSQGSFLSPKPIAASVKQNPVTIASGQGCGACGGPSGTAGGAASASRVPKMKNDRQEGIFWKLIHEYTRDLFDCFFVCNKDFADAVNAYDQPAGINLVNSTRLIELTDELRNVTKGMTHDQVNGTKLLTLIGNLDAIDWAFLKDDKLSAPFWKSVEGSTPKPVAQAFHALAKKGAPSHDDVTKGLDKALAKLKR